VVFNADFARLQHFHELSLHGHQAPDIMVFQSGALMATLPRSIQSQGLHVNKRLLIVRPTIIKPAGPLFLQEQFRHLRFFSKSFSRSRKPSLARTGAKAVSIHDMLRFDPAMERKHGA
jgi:hypothetical protein